MCGFAGVYDREGTKDYDIEAAVQRIRHRGPDEKKIENIEGNFQIGFVRLSIIDITGGSQPMHSQDGRIIVMCNGEIYNYKELREELQSKGYIFHSSSDTEVLLRMYEIYGIDMLPMLQGMFAVAIIDRNRDRTYLIRDRIGIKPLYYCMQKRGLCGFGSEIKPLLSYPFVTKSIDREAMAEFLSYEYIQAPKTIFKDIRQVMPGHYICLKGNDFEEKEYWDCNEADVKTSMPVSEVREGVLGLLKKSVELHLRSDVPVGIFLSGGIDSGLLAALASECKPNLDTYTLRFEGAEFDESGLAQLVADRYHTNHHCHTVKADDFERFLPEMAWHFDQPLGDSGILPNYILNSLIRKDGTKVILSGAGGDELFGGYTYYFQNQKEKYITAFPHAAAILSKLSKKINPDFAKKINRALSYTKEPFEYMLLRKTIQDREFLSRLTGYDIETEGIKRAYYEKCKNDDLNKLLYVDIKTYLADDLLLLSDRSCMAHSVEGRVPFLHHPLVEYAMGIPQEVKAPNGQRKWLLKEIAKDYLPKEVIEAPKRGFCSPVQRWKKLGLGQYAYRILNEEKCLNREVWNTENFRRFVSDKKNYEIHFLKIYLFLILELYFRVHVDNGFENAEMVRV